MGAWRRAHDWVAVAVDLPRGEAEALRRLLASRHMSWRQFVLWARQQMLSERAPDSKGGVRKQIPYEYAVLYASACSERAAAAEREARQLRAGAPHLAREKGLEVGKWEDASDFATLVVQEIDARGGAAVEEEEPLAPPHPSRFALSGAASQALHASARPSSSNPTRKSAQASGSPRMAATVSQTSAGPGGGHPARIASAPTASPAL